MKKSEALNILGLKDGASDEEVKQAHRKLVVENHPDKFGDDATRRAEAEEKTKLINEARDVLISRKWEPEYRTAGTPYADPFAGGRPGTAGSNPFDPFAGGNPFAGFPFGGATFVWTTYDPFTGERTTYTSGGGSSAQTRGAGSTGNPFVDGTATFQDFFDKATPADVLVEEIQRDLKRDYSIIGIKVLVLILATVLGLPGAGVFLYVIGSIGRAVWHNLRGFSMFLLVPLTFAAMIFAPAVRPNAVGFFALLFLICAVYYDIRSIRRLNARLREAKARL